MLQKIQIKSWILESLIAIILTKTTVNSTSLARYDHIHWS